MRSCSVRRHKSSPTAAHRPFQPGITGVATRRRQQRIEIYLPTRKTVVPGTAPSQPPICLLPPRDSTAVIHDKPPSEDKQGRKWLHYIIGWTDLPAARVAMSLRPSTMSPWEMENWEYEATSVGSEGEASEKGEERQGRLPRTTVADRGSLRRVPTEDEELVAGDEPTRSLSPQLRRPRPEPFMAPKARPYETRTMYRLPIPPASRVRHVQCTPSSCPAPQKLRR